MGDQTCWRKCFRWHLVLAGKHTGFMFQLVEWDDAAKDFCLGPGQKIEEEIAHSIPIKIFSIKIRNFSQEHDIKNNILANDGDLRTLKGVPLLLSVFHGLPGFQIDPASS